MSFEIELNKLYEQIAQHVYNIIPIEHPLKENEVGIRIGNSNHWEVLVTDERGFKSIIFKAADENTAFDKLYKLVGIHERLNK